MTRKPFNHGSFTIERTCDATPERIFRAFSEQAAKHRWFACHDDWPVLAYTLDFRVGGREHYRGKAGGMEHSMDAYYWDIVPNERIIWAYEMHVGGAHRIIMRLPDGVDYPIRGVYREITAPSRLQISYDLSEHPPEFHRMWREATGAAPDAPPVQILTTVELEALGARATRLTVIQRFDSNADRDANLKLGAIGGWNDSFEKLDALLAAV